MEIAFTTEAIVLLLWMGVGKLLTIALFTLLEKRPSMLKPYR